MVGSAETNEGNPIQATPMVVSGTGSDQGRTQKFQDSHPDAKIQCERLGLVNTTTWSKRARRTHVSGIPCFQTVESQKEAFAVRQLSRPFFDSYLIRLTCEMSNDFKCIQNVASEFGVDPIRSDSQMLFGVVLSSHFYSGGVVNFCSGCGASRGSGPFCSQCGQRLETA